MRLRVLMRCEMIQDIIDHLDRHATIHMNSLTIAAVIRCQKKIASSWRRAKLNVKRHVAEGKGKSLWSFERLVCRRACDSESASVCSRTIEYVLDNGPDWLPQRGSQLTELPKAPCTKRVYATKLKARLSRSVSDQLQACLWSWANYLFIRKGRSACWWSHTSHHHFMRTEQCEPPEMKFQPKTCERNMRKHYNDEYAHH